jgi:hypothetical protein
VAQSTATALEQVLDDWGRCWSSHDMDGLLALFTDDVIYEDVTMGVVNHGKDELQRFGQGFFVGFPNVTFEVISRLPAVPPAQSSGSCAERIAATYRVCQLRAKTSTCAGRQLSISRATKSAGARTTGTWSRS